MLTKQRIHQRPAGRVAVRLQTEEDVVNGTDLGWVVGGVGEGHEVASFAEYANTVLPHGL